MRLLILITTVLIILPASNVQGMATHSIHIEWTYALYPVPTDVALSAYHLYKDGTKVCQFDTPYTLKGDCEFASNNGLFTFTLTAVFEDGTVNPRSAPFPFFLGNSGATKAGGLVACF
jgi:hypothetical protein